jgi:hypothetical protein
MGTNKRGLLLFLGIALFTQAVTSLVGGVVFLNPFNTATIDGAFMQMVAGSTGAAYASILLQVVTAVVIIMLGVAMYRIAGHLNKAMADVALGMYVTEAILLLIGQAFVYGLLQAARLYTQGGGDTLIAAANILYACRQFCGEIAMIPFGVGALIFYCQIMKAGVIPKWLGIYGLVTVPLILVFVPLGTFGVEVPFLLMVPYLPFEFFTGAYLIFRALGKRALAV